MDIRETVREFIIDNYYASGTIPLPDDASLLERGLIDSKKMLEIVNFIEDEFGILFDDQDIMLDNVDSITRITEFIQRKKMT